MMHIGQGLVCGLKIREMVEAGFEFVIFLADWHSMVNNKFGGDMDKIRRVGEYFKHCFTALGLPEGTVHYTWASELAERPAYWERVLRVGKVSTAQRIMRALPILGREIGQDSDIASLFYPCMQAADIFEMRLDVACAGVDQRKAHILAREAGEKLGWGKPVCLHTPILMGLAGLEAGVAGNFDEDPKLSRVIAAKMSKSKAESSILIHDSPKVIGEKLRRAFCPPGVVEGNPVLEYFRALVFSHSNMFVLKRDAKYGGDLAVTGFEELERLYVAGKVHPQDLKVNMARFLSDELAPVREYFDARPKVLEEVRGIEAG
jgi:tyrosyl-tRNA synthetase